MHAATMERQSQDEIVPHHNDILLGRGGKNNQHVGNEQLRNIARSQRDNYRHSSKKGKSYISRQIVSYVRGMDPPGRFLKKCSITGKWEDMGDDVAREKAAQALRDAVSALHSEESGGGGGGSSSASLSPARRSCSEAFGDSSSLDASPSEHVMLPGGDRATTSSMVSMVDDSTENDYWQEHRRSSSAPAAVMTGPPGAAPSAFRSPMDHREGGAPGAKRSRSYEHNPIRSGHYRTPRYSESHSRPHHEHPHHDIAAETEYSDEFAPPRTSSSYSAGPGSTEQRQLYHSHSSSAARAIQPSPVRVSPEGAQNTTPPRMDSSPSDILPVPLSPGKIQLTPICSNAKGMVSGQYRKQHRQQQWEGQQEHSHQPYHPGEQYHDPREGDDSKYPAEYVPGGIGRGNYEHKLQHGHPQYRPNYRHPDYVQSRPHHRSRERRRPRRDNQDPLLGDFHANSSMNDEDFDLFDGDLLRDTGAGGRGGSSSTVDDDVKSASTF